MLLGKTAKDLRTLSFDNGQITVKVKPSDALTYHIARSRGGDAAAKVREGGDIIEELGFDSNTVGDLKDPHVLIGFGQLIYAVELGVMLIEGWEGVDDAETKETAPVNRETIIQFMRHLAPEFLAQESAETVKWRAAGNA